jgi:hypothetical protein
LWHGFVIVRTIKIIGGVMTVIRQTGICAGLIVFFNLLLVSVAQDSSAGSKLERLRSTFEKECRKIQEEQMAAVVGLHDLYITKINGIEKSLQAKGLLEPLLEVKKERERFSGEHEIREDSLVVKVPELLSVQRECLAILKKIPLDPAKKMLTLAAFYDKSLSELQSEITKSGELESALEVKKERDAIEKREEVIAARKVIADADARKPVDPAGRNDVAVKNAEPVESKPKTTTRKYTGTAENQIRKRFSAFVDAIGDQDFDSAVKMVNPEQVKQYGARMAENAVKLKFWFFRKAENPGIKILVDTVKISNDGVKADVAPKIWVNNDWRKLEKMDWIEVEGEWYIHFDNASVDGQPQPGQPGPGERGPGDRRPVNKGDRRF